MTSIIRVSLDFVEDVAQFVKRDYPQAQDYRVLSKSLDARGANRGKRPSYNYQIEISQQKGQFCKSTDNRLNYPQVGPFKNRPIIVGGGPAGLFCALKLLDYGVPSTVIERGEQGIERAKKIARFWRYGELDPESNVSFGEGGAGFFSDGKLITRIKSPYTKYVMKRLVDFGAPPEIMYLNAPHLGSNKMGKIIGRITNFLTNNGCEVLFNSCFQRLILNSQGNKVQGLELVSGKKHCSNNIILATGHSARDVYLHLSQLKVKMQAKDFAVGVRIEHPRSLIDRLQYGPFSDHSHLGAASYRFSYNNPQGQRGTYSFCMCPGGIVLSSGNEKEGLVSNGMSNAARKLPHSNSALVVTVRAGVDFPLNNILSGIEFQRQIEYRAWQQSKMLASGKELIAMNLFDFLDNRQQLPPIKLKSSCPSGTIQGSLSDLFPPFVTEHLAVAIKKFDQKLPGFIDKSALLVGPETRTSSPLTICRDLKTLESLSIIGLYPCGEGSGYGGGITSAAIDGVKVALSLLSAEKSVDITERS